MIKRSGKNTRVKKIHRDKVNNYVPNIRMVVIDENGENLGMLSKPEALKAATERNLDLLCVSPKSNPPVAKIIDYGKFCYARSKKERESRKHQQIFVLKEIRITPQIGEGDFNFKIKHAIEFLKHGDKVKISLKFKGRQMAFKDLGRKTIDKFLDKIVEYGVLDGKFKDQGRFLNAIVNPINKKEQNAKNENKESLSKTD